MEEEEDINIDDSFSSGSPRKHKKAKKHKVKHDKHDKHKKKKKRSLSGTTGESDGVVSPPSIKLKIKIGGQTLSSQSVTVSDEAEGGSIVQTHSTELSANASVPSSWQTLKDDVFRTKRSDDDTSDEEREWLEALEAGELDDSGRVKKDKDPKLLTARQRALLHGDSAHLLELPTGYKNKEMTEEQLQRRQQRAKKRREQAHEKREKDKKQTLDRILKKQETKGKGGKAKGGRRSHFPGIRYSNKPSLISVSVPPGMQFPFAAQPPKPPPPVTRCGIAGCRNLKKYSCSKTGVPLCSLECYKKNLASQPVAPPLVSAST